MGRLLPHTACARGTKVRVTLKDGRTFIDKFLERTPGKWLLFATHGCVRAGTVNQFIIWKSGVVPHDFNPSQLEK
jgi:hypothetical protein